MSTCRPARSSRSRGPTSRCLSRVKADLSVAVGEDVIARDALAATLDAATNGNKDERIFLRADKAVSYGELMEVMNAAAQRRLSQDRPGWS